MPEALFRDATAVRVRGDLSGGSRRNQQRVNLFGSGMNIEDSSVKPLSCIPYSKTSD